MCGICGIFDNKNAPIDRQLLEKMTTVMSHRGPDGEGYYLSPGIGLGHRRLSIIDLDGGAQPISNEDGRIQIVFNGEIYNFVELRKELEKTGHTFKTRSDTEVIIHGYEQWGKDCVSHFNGIFAFGLWDGITQSLFLARDHLGVKPLYYIQLPNKLLFASEIKSLVQDPDCPREVDLKGLADLFTFRYVPSPNTLFKGIKKLSPANWMVCSGGEIKIERYWKWRPLIKRNRSEAELMEQYQWLLEDAIRLQLRSDVPVGLFLSSGVHSGTLLAIMSGLVNTPVRTFTIGFEGGEATNETDDAREMARKYGSEHSEMIVTPRDYEKYFERLLWDIEEPVGHEPAGAFYFVSKIASEKVKVVLTGQGADEPWAGYHRYIGVKLSRFYSKLPCFLTDSMRGIAQIIPRNQRLKRGVAALDERDMLTRFAKIYSFFSAEMKDDLFQDWVKNKINQAEYDPKEAIRHLQEEVKDLDPLSQILYIDTRASLPDDLLTVNDKTSMANSIEARVPFLDYRLVEFIETLPPHLKLKGFQGKFLHKKAVKKWLPEDVIYRKKKGFDNPIDKWLRTQMRSYLNDCLLSDQSSILRFFDRQYIENLIKKHEEKQEGYLRHLYLLVSLELWHRTFIPNS